MNHTPLPWKQHQMSPVTIIGADGVSVAKSFKNQNAESDAALIVRAVNNHQKLVDALHKIEKIADWLKQDGRTQDGITKANAAKKLDEIVSALLAELEADK